MIHAPKFPDESYLSVDHKFYYNSIKLSIRYNDIQINDNTIYLYSTLNNGNTLHDINYIEMHYINSHSVIKAALYEVKYVYSLFDSEKDRFKTKFTINKILDINEKFTIKKYLRKKKINKIISHV